MNRRELLVVAAVIALAAYLILPAIQTTGRLGRSPCLNNIRNVTLATHNRSAGGNGILPLLEDGQFGWCKELLPFLDKADLVHDGRVEADAHIDVFICPNDPEVRKKPGALSYVANAGYGNFSVGADGAVSETGEHSPDIDLDGDGDVSEREREINFATGVFWRKGAGEFQMNLDFISKHDGLGQTLMFAESLNAGKWASRKAMDIAFVIGRQSLTFSGGPTGDDALAIRDANLGPFAPNGGKERIRGRLPGPSSVHPGIVVVSFCDGRVRTISNAINPTVYARLMIPAGGQWGQGFVHDNEY